MWGSQGWNQWALQPAMFNDVPHEQIDWAELAKQWIQMQQTEPSNSVAPSPSQQIAPSVSLPLPPGHESVISEELPDHNINRPLLKNSGVPGIAPELFSTQRSFEQEPDPYVPKSEDSNFWNKPQWESSGDIDHRVWNAPPNEPAAPLIGGKETFDYGHMHDNAPLAMQTIDYNHMSDYSYNQIYTPPVPPPPPPENQYDQYWSHVNASPAIAPIFLKKERNSSSTTVQAEEESTQLDAAKRKQLPAWIRDGLEKMEQERLKRLEKERNAKEQAEKISKTASLKKELNMKSSLVAFVPKSKFESDSEGEQPEEIPVKKASPILKRVASPIEDMRTDEEKKQDLMLKVRRTLTEVLLSVTNSEMVAIAQEVYKKVKSKAPARQLASSTSLTSVASGLRGLASYDTESEASDADERKDSSDSEEELYRKIKEKKKLFAVKEKRIIAELERKELEDKTDREKINNGNVEKNPKDNVVNAEEDEEEAFVPEDKISPIVPFQRSVSSNDIPFINEKSEDELAPDDKTNDVDLKSNSKPDKSNSSESSSSSSESESDSSEINKKKTHKESKKDKYDKIKRDKSPKRYQHHKHSKNRDSDSSEKHKRGRSSDRTGRKSSNKKRKKTRRSVSSSSSSSISHKKKSSKHVSSRHREKRSHSYEDRKHVSSVSPVKSHRKKDSRSHGSSHRYRDDKYDKRYREEKKYRDSRKSSSPHKHTAKLPRKYRTSRSLSSETESSGKKLKKSRNH